MRLLSIFSPGLPFNDSYKSCFPNQAHIVGTLKNDSLFNYGATLCVFQGLACLRWAPVWSHSAWAVARMNIRINTPRNPSVCAKSTVTQVSNPKHNEPKMYHPLWRLLFHVATFTPFCPPFSQTGTLLLPSMTAKNEASAYAKMDITAWPKNVTDVWSTLPANQDIRLNPTVRRVPLMLPTIFLH